jgi:hypothetical protein
MYYKIYIPEIYEVENMDYGELRSLQTYFYNNFPTSLDEMKKSRCVSERLNYIDDQTHT